MAKQEWRINACSCGGVMVRLCPRPIIELGANAGAVNRCEECLSPYSVCRQAAYFRGPKARQQAEDFVRSANPNGALARKAHSV